VGADAVVSMATAGLKRPDAVMRDLQRPQVGAGGARRRQEAGGDAVGGERQRGSVEHLLLALVAHVKHLLYMLIHVIKLNMRVLQNTHTHTYFGEW